LDIGVLGYIGIVQHKEHSPEVLSIPPGTPCINSNNIPPIMIINRIYEIQNLLSLYFVSFPVGLRTYQHPCTTFVRNISHFKTNAVRYKKSTHLFM